MAEDYALLASVRALRRRWLFITAGCLGGALIGLVMSLAVPRRYTATATVFVLAPTYASPLRPEPMMPEGYRRLSESEYVIQSVRQALTKQLGTGDGVSFESKLYSTGDPQRPSLPLLGLSATADSPERAQTAANVWSEFLVHLQSGLDRDRTEATVKFFAAEKPKADRTALETEQAAQSAASEREVHLIQLDEQLRISKMERETERLNWTQLNLTNELQRVDARAKESRERLENYLSTLAKVSSDGAPRAASNVASWKLLDDTIVAERARADGFEGQVASIERQLREVNEQIGRVSADLTTAMRRRDQLDREWKTRVEALQQQAQTLRAAQAKMQQTVAEARLATAQDAPILKAAGPPPLPLRPSSPNVQLNTILGAVLGLFVMFGYSWIIAAD